ncbi:MAG: MFS transporter [Anaerolineales bacterium]|nr:MFS transporter [Anaerolineales bacterium]
MLLIGIVLLQFSSNFAQGPLQALMPDIVPDDQRGRSSGVKTVLGVIPAILIIFIGPLVNAGRIGLTVAIIGGALLITMLITVRFVHEEALRERPQDDIKPRLLRLVALTTIFVLVTQTAVWMVRAGSEFLSAQDTSVFTQVSIVGFLGLIGMAGSIFLGVYFGAWVGIGEEASGQRPFIWWVINRLLFLAAVGSIQGFAQFYMTDVLKVDNPATMTTVLMAVVALFLMTSALAGGYLADRFGRRRLVAFGSIVAALGTLVLILSTGVTMAIVSGCIIGIGAGTFMATNWALGTDLAPAKEAGRYLGISNLAGAGAGIVGAGIGGPMADFFNQLKPGLGYLVIFGIYGMLFLLSAATLSRVPENHESGTAA